MGREGHELKGMGWEEKGMRTKGIKGVGERKEEHGNERMRRECGGKERNERGCGRKEEWKGKIVITGNGRGKRREW